jgi:hypothetical protein
MVPEICRIKQLRFAPFDGNQLTLMFITFIVPSDMAGRVHPWSVWPNSRHSNVATTNVTTCRARGAVSSSATRQRQIISKRGLDLVVHVHIRPRVSLQ